LRWFLIVLLQRRGGSSCSAVYRCLPAAELVAGSTNNTQASANPNPPVANAAPAAGRRCVMRVFLPSKTKRKYSAKKLGQKIKVKITKGKKELFFLEVFFWLWRDRW
jgi:hypothetical protein